VDRLEREATLLQARVGNLQAGLVDDLVAVQQEVEVDRPRAAWRSCAGAAEGLLDLEEPVEQVSRRKARVDRHRAVQEARLVGDPNRVGHAKARDADDFDLTVCLEQPHGAVQHRLAVAEIRAEPDVRLHERSTVAAEYSTGRPSVVLRTRTRTR